MSESLPEAEDRALVLRAKTGDRAAFEVLVRHSADRLYAVVLRSSASEADAHEASKRRCCACGATSIRSEAMRDS